MTKRILKYLRKRWRKQPSEFNALNMTYSNKFGYSSGYNYPFENGAQHLTTDLNALIKSLEDQFAEEERIVPEVSQKFSSDDRKKVFSAITQVVQVQATKYLIEIRDHSSVIFTGETEFKQTFYIKYFFNVQDDEPESYYSFYENRTCLYNGFGSFEKVLSDLRGLEYLLNNRLTKATTWLLNYYPNSTANMMQNRVDFPKDHATANVPQLYALPY